MTFPDWLLSVRKRQPKWGFGTGIYFFNFFYTCSTFENNEKNHSNHWQKERK